jgi:hypothetical protein
MVDIRRALPTVPLALIVGALAGSMTVPGIPLPVGSGLVAVPIAAVLIYRHLSDWDEAARRRLGYACAVVVAVVTTAGLWMLALGTSLCGTWGEQCTPAENAAISRYGALGLVSLVAIPGVYTALDLATRKR